MLKGVIFDKDGVLTDTEGIIEEAIKRVIVKFSTLPYENDSKKLRGASAKSTFALILEKYQIPLSLDEILIEYEKEYENLLTEKNDVIIDGVVGALKDLTTSNLHLAVATNSNRLRTKLSLRGIEKFFDVIVTSDDVTNPKPAPDAFLLACEKLGLYPDECAVIGDTDRDCIAAHDAGMKFVFKDNALNLELSYKPELTIKSMRELNTKRLQSLFEV